MRISEFDERWPSALTILNREWVDCRRCPRLVAWREEVAETKRRAYQDEEYWGRPVPSFGDPAARLVIVGLAPGAHGANRTGRMFTGDRSGEFLYRALFEAGFANQATSSSRNDGLVLTDAFITAPVRCVPPDNKPERCEVIECQPMFQRELDLLKNVKVIVALGAFGFSEYLAYLQSRGKIKSRGLFPFGHNKAYRTYNDGPLLIGCYHPSQQNTSTGKLTAEMLEDVFARARHVLDSND